MKTEKIEVPIFCVDFTLRIYEDESEHDPTLPDYAFRDRIGGVDYQNDIYIFLNKYLDLQPWEVAHEAKHVVNEIIIHIHAKLDPKNDEFECYLLQWVMEQIYKHL